MAQRIVMGIEKDSIRARTEIAFQHPEPAPIWLGRVFNKKVKLMAARGRNRGTRVKPVSPIQSCAGADAFCFLFVDEVGSSGSVSTGLTM